ncbi:MAG: NAD(P)-binding domain-containing protein [Chloroflexi bacterium]|nr:NAD(P)-binding domain-containing protein [Chloroflexota bacterium]
MSDARYLIVGAGHGGKAMAAHLALMGFDVMLYNRTPEHVAAIKSRGGIDLLAPEGVVSGFARLHGVTSDLREALAWADIIMMVVPSFAHRPLATQMALHLRDGQIVILHPGRTFGALEFRHVLQQEGCQAQVVVAEAQTFIYASRSEGPAQARIFRIKEAVPLAALPAVDTSRVLEAIRPAFPQFIDGVNVLHTGLDNIGAIFHPAISLLNAGWIEATGGNFRFYHEGVTPTVARIMEALDRERVTVAAALGIRAVTAREWLQIAYNARGDNLYEAIHNQVGYQNIKAPGTLQHRYLLEDVPMSLVPIANLGQRYGVSVRAMESLIRLASIAHGTDYWRRGRTLARLGIEHLSVAEIQRYVQEGVLEHWG